MSKEIKNQAFTELEQLASDQLMDKEQRNKALLKWTLRNIATYCIVAYFWEHKWTMYILCILIPLSLLSLVMLLSYNKIMQQRINKAKEQVDKL